MNEEQASHPRDALREVFEFWKVVHGHERAQLGDKRKKVIRIALRTGYSVDDLKLAIVGCKRSRFHQGANERDMVYDDIELILRDEAHIDAFIKLGQEELDRDIGRAQREADLQQSKDDAVPMPAKVREQMDALFAKWAPRRPS